MSYYNLKRRKAPKMGVRERPQVRSEKFKQYVRGFPCLLAGKPGHVCSGRIQFAHVRMEGDGGMGLKPSDSRGLPMCENAHLWDQHVKGEKAFEAKWGVNLVVEAERHWNAWLNGTEAGRAYRREREMER